MPEASYVQRLADANINPVSHLATDYMNTFNGVVMLLDMAAGAGAADLPDLTGEIVAWAPQTYAEHFATSGFRHGDLAVEAFECAPAPYRDAFETLRMEMDAAVADAARFVCTPCFANMCPEERRERLALMMDAIRAAEGKLQAVIDGDTSAVDEDAAASATSTQDEIDKLFD